jgi:hypothetical protein
VHFRHDPADFSTIRRCGCFHGTPTQAAHQGGGLSIQFAQAAAVMFYSRIGARDIVLGQVLHKVQKVRQLIRAILFKQRQHITPVRSRNKVIGIGNAGRDTLQVDQVAQRIGFEPFI